MDHHLSNSVLVLGSTGFIGNHLVNHLAGMGYQVYALARSAKTEASHGGITHIRGSIDDPALLRDLISRSRHIVHAAGLTTPSVSAFSPQLEVSTNLASLANLLSLSGDFPDRRLIYLSSAGAVYGDNAVNIEESASLKPRSYYGAGKAAAEMFIHACTATSTWQAVVFRPSNIYGPGQRMGKGFAIVPTLFSRALDGAEFKIWGDGNTVRDYCYVADLVELTAKAIECTGGPRYAVHNAASGETASILELITRCERIAGRTIHIDFLPARGVDVPHVSLNTRSAFAQYRWEASVPLEKGLAQTWHWLQSRATKPADEHE